jgi:mannosyltransferase OCH1-like enzyme
MIPKIIHQTSRALTREESRLIFRMRRHLSDWSYRYWSDVENDAMVAEHFPEYLESYRSIQRGVIKADIARCMYVSVFGGFYFDTDYKMIRQIGDALLKHRCVLPISREGAEGFRLGNAVFGSEPGYPFWTDFLAHIFAEERLSVLPESEIEKITGPEGLTDFFLSRRDQYPDVVLPAREIFHPPLTRGGLSFLGNEDTIGAHLCWGSWRTKPLAGKLRVLAVRNLTSLF